MELFVQWRLDDDVDGYRETPGEKQIVDDVSNTAFKHRARLFTHAARLMDSQHRLFLFAVDIYGSRARLYRFDPSCVVVSEPIHYRQDPQLLYDFFFRYSSLSPEQRGFDPTVVPATEAEKKLFRTRVKEYFKRAEEKNLRVHPDVEMLASQVSKVQVNDVKGKARWYLASKCHSIPVHSSPCGRFTRGFIATPLLDDESLPSRTSRKLKPRRSSKHSGKLFWLKDCWRPASVESEVSIYYKLRARGVSNLPDIICAGDVSDGKHIQQTLNDSLISRRRTLVWIRPTAKIQHRIHHRIVSEMLIPLDSIENARELLIVGRDILNGMYSPGSMLSNVLISSPCSHSVRLP